MYRSKGEYTYHAKMDVFWRSQYNLLLPHGVIMSKHFLWSSHSTTSTTTSTTTAAATGDSSVSTITTTTAAKSIKFSGSGPSLSSSKIQQMTTDLIKWLTIHPQCIDHAFMLYPSLILNAAPPVYIDIPTKKHKHIHIPHSTDTCDHANMSEKCRIVYDTCIKDLTILLKGDDTYVIPVSTYKTSLARTHVVW